MAPWLAVAGVLAGAGAILAAAGLMASSGLLISRAAARPPIADLMLLFVAVRFFGVARPALRYLERLASHDVTFRFLLLIRRWFVAALLPLSSGQLTAFRAGDLLSRLAADVETLQEAWPRVIAPALVVVLVSSATVTMLAFVDFRLALVVLALLVFNGVVWSWIAHRRARGVAAARNEQRRAQSADLVTLVQGLEDVLAFGHERTELARFAARQQRWDAVEARDGRQLAGHVAMGTAVTALAFWSVLGVTVAGAGSGQIPAVWIAAVVLATVAAFESVEGLPAAWQSAACTRDAARRVLEVVAAPPAVSEPRDAVALRADAAPAVRLENVTFGYGPAPVIRGASFDVAAGEHVGIVGATGAGKSTILALLARGWDPSCGRITLDGTDLRRLRLGDLRARLAVLPQQIHVFNESLRDNVRLARPGASDADVTAALARAGLAGYVAALPRGLDTILGEHGARMSAGERQRLGLARILQTEARLVLADEPTANLDAAHEQQILEALSDWARGRTMIVVSHRPAALTFVGRVLVVDGGRVSERRPARLSAAMNTRVLSG